MRKGVKVLSILLFLVSIASVYGAEPVTTNTSDGNASVNLGLGIIDFTTIYHYDAGSGVGRNYDYPTFEYVFDTDNVHFWAKIEANTVAGLENAEVNALLYLDGSGTPIEVPLTFVTGIGAQYNPNTGKYEGEFEGDFVVDMSYMTCGDYHIYVEAGYGSISVVNYLTALKYQNVNDILALDGSCVDITILENEGLVFNLVPLQFNPATDYPKIVTIVTPVDREGQGVVGNTSLAVLDYVGNCGGTPDYLGAHNIRFSTTEGIGSWVFLNDNSAFNQNTVYTLIQYEMSTLGTYSGPGSLGDWDSNLYFQLFFDSNHCATSFDGGALGIKLQVY